MAHVFNQTFTYDEEQARYFDAAGRMVSDAEVRAALDGYLRNTLSSASEQLFLGIRSGSLSVRELQIAAERDVVKAFLCATALIHGGWAQLTPADFGRVGGLVKPVLEQLRDALATVANGAPLDRRVINEIREAMNAARAAFHYIEGIERVKQGFDEYENILADGTHHCQTHKGRPSCISVTRRGRVKIGQLPRSNMRGCYGNCCCRFRYWNSITGESRE